MGLGHFGGGAAAARWLAAAGAKVTVTDTAPASALVDSLAALSGAAIAATPLTLAVLPWSVAMPSVV